jgi:coenzyme F420-reducing hydrogenase delta subunit
LLGILGIASPRLKLEHFATGEIQRLKSAVDSFVNEVASLGPI